MKLLHIADTHFGAKLSGFNKEGMQFIRERIERSWNNLERLFQEDTYDGFLFVGDIFDSLGGSPYFIKKLEKLFKIALDRGAFVAYATGNHDYFISKKQFKSLSNNPNFILFTEDKVERRELTYKGKKIAFYGIGYRCLNPRENLNGKFLARQEEDLAIGLLHGDVYSGSQVDSPYYSCSSEYLADLNYDYLALGHIHSFKKFHSNIIYPGCPFPQGLDEGGEKFALSVEIDRSFLDVQKLHLVDYQVFDLEFEAEALNRFELATKLETFLEENIGVDLGQSIVRLRGKVHGFDDYLTNDDEEFKRELFGFSSYKRHLMDLKFERAKKLLNLSLPKDLEDSLNMAIEEFRNIDEPSYLFSNLDCHLKVSELMEEMDVKSEIIKIMRKEDEN